MNPSPFIYRPATTAEEAVALLAEHGDDAKVLAGGQSLVPMMNLRLAQPAVLVDVNGLPDPGIRAGDGWLAVPAGARHRTLAADPAVTRHAPMLAEAAAQIGNVRVRNRGTIGGSVAHADPAAELPCALIALDAQIVVTGPGGHTRTVPAGQFFVSFLATILEPAELVTEVRVPVAGPRTGQAFGEFTRRAGDFATVEVAAVVELDTDGQRCTGATVALGGVADRPLRLDGEATAALTGRRPDDPAALDEVAEHARTAADPHDDVHATAAYRRHLIGVLTRRVLAAAGARVRRGGDAA